VCVCVCVCVCVRERERERERESILNARRGPTEAHGLPVPGRSLERMQQQVTGMARQVVDRDG
jgi:hypothetical protein